MSAETPVAGYPVHRISSYRGQAGANGRLVTYWTSACGSEHVTIGELPQRFADSVRDGELCVSGCWPQGPNARYPRPVDESAPFQAA